MAIGFTPQYSEDLYLENFTPQQFLVIALESAKQVNWRIDFISETGFIAYSNNGRFSWNANITFKIDDDKATIKSESAGNDMFDLGKNKRTVGKFTTAFIDLKYSLTPEQLQQQFAEIEPTLAPKEKDVLSLPPETASEKVAGVFALFKPREGYFITPVIIDLNILIFIIMVISGVGFMQPNTADLISWGANFRPVTLGGQGWRLLTNCFLHIGIMHLLLNMYALIYVGLLLEPRLGKSKFAAAYLLTGIAASLTSLWWHDLTVSAGASGAIFGMYGVFLAMLTTNLIEKKSRMPLLTSIGIFVLYNLAYGMKGGIDNAAHIGGLISGLIIGYAYYPSLKKPDAPKLEYSTIALLAVLVLSSSFILVKKIPNDIPKYEAKIKTFSSNESQALEIYHMRDNTPKDSMLYEIKERGIYYWNQNIRLLQEADQLSIPEMLHDRDRKLLTYCELRIKSYHLIYKAIDENTTAYKDSIAEYNDQIGDVLKSLKTKTN